MLKPGGSLFITTINKTQLSYALGIVFAEQIAGIVPKGTHTWEKFVSPEKLESILESNGLSVQTVVGMLYNPFSGYWHWIENTSLNYAAHAVKQAHPGPAELVFEGEAAKASTHPGGREEPKEWIVSEDCRNTAWKYDIYKYKKYTVYLLREDHAENKVNKRVKILDKSFCCSI